MNTGSNTGLEWKVVALWEGLEFVSGVRSVTVAQVASPAAPVVTVGGRDTAEPWVDVSWPAVPGTDSIIIYRKNVLTDAVEELARVSGTNYRDSAVSYGDSFAYSLATVVGATVSPAGTGESRAFCRRPCTNAKPPGSLKDGG